ncbi:MAG: SO_0444 family Cu/Zn efflux transporter [Candidatus Muiribacteriota bacterium]
MQVLVEIWEILGQMSLSLIFGFLIAGILSEYINEKFIQKHLGKNSLMNSIKASFFGIPLPICSCGIIPLISMLKKSGASDASIISFLISTPQTGADSIAVTYSLLGPVYAVYRPVSAFISGILGGFTAFFLKEKKATIKCELETCSSCSTQNIEKNVGKNNNSKIKNRISNILKYAFITIPKDISVSLAVGLLISALISTFVPESFFIRFAGYNNIQAMLLMIIAGIPIYICSTSSVPIAASLVLQGISPGAALIFLMTGPATNSATIISIFKIMGKKNFFIYLFSIIITALLSGILMDILFKNISPEGFEMTQHSGSSITGSIAAVFLIVILLNAFIRNFYKS